MDFHCEIEVTSKSEKQDREDSKYKVIALLHCKSARASLSLSLFVADLNIR